VCWERPGVKETRKESDSSSFKVQYIHIVFFSNFLEVLQIIFKVYFFVIASVNCYSILLQDKELVKR
jgi:hypothetical protein